MLRIRLSVSVDDAHLEQFSDIVEECRRAGLRVERELKSVGVVAGSIDAAKAEALCKIRGVAHVEVERQIHVLSPGDDLRWTRKGENVEREQVKEPASRHCAT